MTETTDDAAWQHFAHELGGTLDSRSLPLEILRADWLGPDGHSASVVGLHVKTKTGRVLCLDMLLEFDGVSDATENYELRHGELVPHVYDFSDPPEVARYFGLDDDDARR